MRQRQTPARVPRKPISSYDRWRWRRVCVTVIGVLVATGGGLAPGAAARSAGSREDGRPAEAQRHYVEGRRLLDTRRSGPMLASIGELEAAVAADPEHALAWAGLAEGSALLGLYSLVEPASTLPRARQAAEQALELDDGLAQAHAVLGLVRYLYDWDFRAAEESFQRALDLDSDYAPAAHWYAMMLAATARYDEALRRIDQALAAGPDSPLLVTKRATLLTAAGRYADAETQLEQARSRFPDYPLVEREWGFLDLRRHAAGGRSPLLEEAVDHFRRAAELAGRGSKAEAGLAYAYGRLGRRRDAEAILAELDAAAATSFVAPMTRALAALGLGHRDQALTLLERAEELHDPGLVYLCIKPGFESLYDVPRFRALAARVGLPPPRSPAVE